MRPGVAELGLSGFAAAVTDIPHGDRSRVEPGRVRPSASSHPSWVSTPPSDHRRPLVIPQEYRFGPRTQEMSSRTQIPAWFRAPDRHLIPPGDESGRAESRSCSVAGVRGGIVPLEVWGRGHAGLGMAANASATQLVSDSRQAVFGREVPVTRPRGGPLTQSGRGRPAVHARTDQAAASPARLVTAW